MKLKLILSVINSLLKVKIFKKRIPLVISWALTYRCNRRCSYCARWQGGNELSTEEVLQVIDELAKLGTIGISFTGGEPLLREDIGEIINYTYKKGVKSKLNSNGGLIRERIVQLKKLDLLNLSLDGPEEIHNSIRGKDSYKETITAAKMAVEFGIKVVFTTVLTDFNLNYIDFILRKAEEVKASVIFQPSTQRILGNSSPNPRAPLETQYRKVIEALIRRKKGGDKTIANSIGGLKHLFNWPHPRRIRCASGWVSCRIEPNGDVIYCSRGKAPSPVLNCFSPSFKEAFENLRPISCDDCWCASRVELNLSFFGNISAAYNQIVSLIK